MTAYSSVDDAVEMIKKGAHDYLTKPLDFDRLRLSLDRALDHHQVEDKKAAKPERREPRRHRSSVNLHPCLSCLR